MIFRHPPAVSTISRSFALAAVLAWLAAAGAVLAQEVEDGAPGDSNLVEAALPSQEALPEAVVVESGDAPDAITEYIHIPGSVFVPMHSDSGVEYAPWGCMYMTGPSDSSNFAVELPFGATVTSLRLYFVDSSATYNGTMQFAEYDDGSGGAYLATLVTSGSGGWGTVTQTGLSLPIDYVNFSYVLYWDAVAAASSQLQLCGFRIGFER